MKKKACNIESAVVNLFQANELTIPLDKRKLVTMTNPLSCAVRQGESKKGGEAERYGK
jgi:DNA-binding TFAR19-related protein (PDSD5 family)